MRNSIQWTDQERQVLARGRNAGATGSTRGRHRHHPAAYQDATALEALLGYLYLTNPARCGEMLQWIHANIDRIQNEADETTSG
jgi:ribonuclease III family protein